MEQNRAGRPASIEKNWPDNDEALLEFSSAKSKILAENYWSLNDAFQGVQVLGGTGSGKSSGSGRALAEAFLSANMGGLVLTAKNDEVLAWQEYAEAAGRTKDLLILQQGSEHRFNFLQYELERPGVGAGHTENLVNLFTSVLEASERRQGQGGAQDAYWQRTLKQLLRNAIDLAVLSIAKLSLPDLHRIITSAPRSADEAASPDWRKKSACFSLLEVAETKAETVGRKSDFELTHAYWMHEFPSLAPETRSVIVSTFTSMADCFLRGMLRTMFCTDLNFRPEDSFAGKIIILNLPVKEYNELGQFAQVLFKYIWQRAVERRIPPGVKRGEAEQTVRPVFLWADESQFFVTSYDSMFQSTARASRACTVYLTQNLPSYFSVFGGANSRSDAEAFLGNLQTKIFHANGDPTTNNWAAESIGRKRQMTYYGGTSESVSQSRNAGINQSAGGSQVMEYLVQPQTFTMLRTGGEECDYEVDGIIFQGGRRWVIPENDGQATKNFIRHVFVQKHEGHAG